MADQSDVEEAVAGMVAGVLYPAGVDAPSAVGAACRIHRGWPDAAGLDADLAAGRVRVSVGVEPGSQSTTTRYPDLWTVTQPRPATLLAFAATDTVTFSGIADAGQLAGVLAGGTAAVHRTIAGDTPASVAAALALALQPVRPASATGAVLTVPGANLVARVAADQTGMRETRRQRVAVRVACWCPNPTLRDATAASIDGALSAVDFVSLPDGSAGRLRYVASLPSDRAQDAALYRRDLLYSVEFATTLTTTLPSLLFSDTQLSAEGLPVKSLLS